MPKTDAAKSHDTSVLFPLATLIHSFIRLTGATVGMTNESRPETVIAHPPGPMRIKYFLLVFLISLFFLGKVLWPFWPILVLSFLLTNLFRPIYVLLCRWMSENMASVLTCMLITAIVFVPLTLFITSLAGEALSFYNWGRDNLVGMKIQQYLQESEPVRRLQEYLADFGFDFKPASITNFFSYVAKNSGLYLYNQASSWAANIMQFVAQFLMMILVIFFLLIDLPKLMEYIIRLSPLPDDEDRLLLQKFEEIANAILKGNGICGLIQGVLGGGLFSVMGLNSPLLWGCLMAVLAFLPIFGIGLVMVPTAAILAINGNIPAGIFMFVYYLILSLSMEYLVKPKMVGKQVKMHTLLVFLAILGGLSVYGILGIIYGPLIVTAFLTLSEIYLKKYDRYVQRL
ncbi:Predicted PurR-regulated permease PerM [Desulfopila aestuarii DSM 18488]|uniref:Predicted PurR-regulated permease PerM n=2 Tax=Desulfopila aestuarii TaxID=231440 RepID=A0A1M7YBH1_9BACT|nr:Predicted PurR-regulated permease PerM [Desulfopila aestuarii DSM 18488]